MDNKFNWKTYEVPHRWLEAEDDLPPSSESFTIRHLKQGATGAVKTWPVAEVLLEYLVQRGGLRDVSEKITPDCGGDNILNLTEPASRPSFDNVNNDSDQSSLMTDIKPYHIVELGGGTGFLSVGLSLALNDIKSSTSPHYPNARLICTDNDRLTIKNMRHNITRQPTHMNMNKSVRIEKLDWGDDIGGEKFSSAVRSQFRKRKMTRTNNTPQPSKKSEPSNDEGLEDPIRLLSHLIASDVHYGHTTLDPLSSVISAVKLRNPHVIVVLLLKERTPNAVAELKEQIEAKVECGLKTGHHLSCYETELLGFEVVVRDVIHNHLEDMKMVEC